MLGESSRDFCTTYGVTSEGNFEHRTTHLVDVARRPRKDHASDRAKLLAERDQRVPPSTDRKRVAAWNGYVISGLARAGSLLGEPSMIDDARARSASASCGLPRAS